MTNDYRTRNDELLDELVESIQEREARARAQAREEAFAEAADIARYHFDNYDDDMHPATAGACIASAIQYAGRQPAEKKP